MTGRGLQYLAFGTGRINREKGLHLIGSTDQSDISTCRNSPLLLGRMGHESKRSRRRTPGLIGVIRVRQNILPRDQQFRSCPCGLAPGYGTRSDLRGCVALDQRHVRLRGFLAQLQQGRILGAFIKPPCGIQGLEFHDDHTRDAKVTLQGVQRTSTKSNTFPRTVRRSPEPSVDTRHTVPGS